MPNPPAVFGPYDSAETVFNLARSLVNDTFAGASQTPGEGRIFIDSAPFIIPLYNHAVRSLQRDLETRGYPSRISEVVIIGLTPVNGPLGLGASDPTIQPYLSYSGYFDGTSLNQSLALPSALLAPQRVWERVSAETNLFNEIFESRGGLESYAQATSLGDWDFRGDAIFFNGSTQIMDIRLRYYSTMGTIPIGTQPSSGQTWAQLWATFNVPFTDSTDALAYHMAFTFCQSQLPTGQADDLFKGYRRAMTGLAARMVRRAQRVRNQRQPYGDTGDLFGVF